MHHMIRNLIVGNMTGIAVNAAVQCSAINGRKPFDWMELCVAGTIAGVAVAVQWAYKRVRHSEASVTTGPTRPKMGKAVRAAP